MDQGLVMRIVLGVFGMWLLLTGLLEINTKMSQKVLSWAGKHPTWWGILTWNPHNWSSVAAEDELRARGRFKTFTGYLLLFVGIFFLVGALLS
jgi:hypothetical protein